MVLALGVLGPVEVYRDGVELALQGARQRTLLASLAADAGRVVPSGVLVDRIWGKQLPARPANALQQQVFKLRRIVGDDTLLFEGSGYRLAAGGDAVDSHRFQDLLGQAGAQLDEAPNRAAARLGEALDLWRGAALAGCADVLWVAGEAARLEELRLQAEELRGEAALRAGRPAEAIGLLEPLARAEPLRERLWALLMTALYRDGRQTDALAAFTAARVQLVGEAGVEPGPELRGLHQSILRQDPALAHLGPRHPPSPSAPIRPAGAGVPSALARHATGPTFVGRSDELAALDDGWSRAVGGELTAVFLSGEPGAGKTRLVAEHARTVAGAGGQVVFGRADEEAAPPYGPLVGILDQLIGLASPELLDAHVAAHGGELGRLLPVLATRVPGLPAPRAADPDTERFRLREAVASLVGAVAERAPLLVVVDDVHWADHASLAALRHLLRGPAANVLVVATYRSTAHDQSPALRAVLGDLLRAPGSRRLELPGLSEQDAEDLLEQMLGHPPSAAQLEQAHAVRRQTGGNALFAIECLHTLTSGTATTFVIPSTVRDAVLRRARSAGDGVEQTLPVAAVIGSTFDLAMLVRVAGAEHEQVLAALEAAGEAGLVTESPEEPGRFSFGHSVIQVALAGALGPSRRQLVHRKAAGELERRGDGDARRPGELARHWIGAGDHARGKDAALAAGDAALELLASHEAADWYRRALALHEAGPEPGGLERAGILLKLGRAMRQAGSDAFGEPLIEAARIARAHGAADLLTRAALANNRGLPSRTGLVDHQRVEILEDARALEGGTPAEQAQLLAITGGELWYGDRDRRHRLSREALGLARQAGDERVLAEVLYRHAFATAEPATLAERLDVTAEAVALSDRIGAPHLQVMASVERARAAIEAADLSEALLHARRQTELAAGCREAVARYGASWAAAWPHTLAGRYDLAERAASTALENATAGEQPDALAFYGAQISVIRWDQGTLGSLADAIAAQSAASDGLPAQRALAALALAEAGRTAEAEELVQEAGRDGFGFPIDGLWLTAMVIWGEACVLCDRPDLAADLLEHLLPWREQVAFTGLAVHGCAARIAAELAGLLEREDADELFATAEDVHARLAAPAFLARTRVGRASWLWRQGQPERAREQLRRAQAAADLCGCPQLLDRAAAIS